MAKWWKFGRGKGREEAPAPAPAEGRSKLGGFLGGLFGRGRKKEAPAEPTPPAEPSAPAVPPTPVAPGGEGEAPPAPEEGGPPAEPPAEPAERTYPPFVHVSADGIWVISDTEWEGTMSGTLHGADVKTFIDAMEAPGGPDYNTAIPLVADAYGIPGGLINVEASTIYSVNY